MNQGSFSSKVNESDWFGQDNSGYSSFDYKRVVARLSGYWYVVLLSILIGLIAAYLTNRYTTRIYTVKASVIIKGNDERIGAEFLYGNPLANSYRNYDNELFLLKSYPLLQSVIEDLNFTAAFYKEGNVKTSEIYEYIPIEVVSNSRFPYGESFKFKLIDKYEFLIANVSGDGGQQKYKLNTTVNVEGYQLTFKIKPENGLNRYLNEELILTFFDPLELAKQYESRLNVSWAGDGTSVINLEINGASPEKEVDFLEGLIRKYHKYDLEKKSFAATKSLDFIDAQLRVISDSLRFFENQLEKFKNKNALPDLGGQGLRLYEKLEKLETEKAELVIHDNYYNYLVGYLSKNENLDQVILPNTIGINDPVLSGLVNKMIDIQMSLRMFSKSKENPLFIEAENRIIRIRQDILESLMNVQQTDKIRLNYLQKEISLIESQLEYIPTAERELVSIKRNYALSESLYLFLMQKRAEAGITKASTISDISVVNPAMMIGGPISPKSLRNYVIGFIIGLIFPIVFFAALEYLNDKVQSREDIGQVCEIPFIGGVGHNKATNKLVVVNRPKSAVSEAFRAMRSNLTFFANGKEKNVFMVTSSLSGEGKTFTTINLAAILALSGKKTVIVGADMRKPRIYDDFNLTNDIGLSTYLIDAAPLKEVIQKTDVDNLFIISAGPVPPNPSELLLRPQVQRLIDEIFIDFDYIVIDTPPVGLVTDAFVLSKFVTHTIFVVRQDYTPKHLLRSINDYYKTGRISNISMILNDIHRSGFGYGYGYGYSYGYGYGYEHAKGYYDEG